MNREDTQIEQQLTTESLAYSLPGAWAQYNLGEEQWQYYKHLEVIEDKLLDVFEGKINRLIISCPSQYGKTNLATKAFSSWYIGREPDTRIVITSYDTDYAAKISGESRNWLELNGPKIFDGIGVDQEQHSRKDWSVIDVNDPERKLQGNIRAIGCGAGIAGQPVDLLLVEDVIKTNAQATSNSYLEMLKAWWEDDIEGRITPKTKVVVIQTRRSTKDLIGILLEEEKTGGDKWEKLFLQEIAEKDDPIIGRKKGEPLWPEMRPLDWCLQKKKNMTFTFWSANRQCKPITVGGNAIKLSWLRRYMEAPHRKDADKVLFSIDTASKDTEVNDYSVIMIWLVLDENKYYLVDLLRDRMQYPQLESTVDDMMDIWKPNEVVIEDRGNGTALGSYINQKTPYSAHTMNPEGSKKLRMDNESPAIRAGKVYVPAEGSCEWIMTLEAELGEFPNVTNDDQIDCLSLFLKYMREESQEIDMW